MGVVYEVVMADNHNDLSAEVTRRLNDGWELCGPMSVVYEHAYETNCLYQPMVKERS